MADLPENKEKILLENQFNELMQKAREIYPDIDESIATFNNVCMEEEALSEYLELLNQPPIEINSNHTSI